MGVPPAVGFLLFWVVLAGAVALGVWGNRRRKNAVRAWALARGWTVVGADPALARRWGGVPFAMGSARTATEILSGPSGGRPAVSFRYTYTTRDGENTARHDHHVVAVFLPRMLPSLDLAPEGFGSKIAKVFGGQDLTFESEHFNARWRVTAPDPRFAHDVIHPRTMERLLQPDTAGMTVRFVGDAVLAWSSGAPRLEAIEPRARLLNDVVDAIPAYVWQDRSYPAW